MRRTTASCEQAFAHDAARLPAQKAVPAHDRVAPDAASCGALKAPWFQIDRINRQTGLMLCLGSVQPHSIQIRKLLLSALGI